MLYNLLPKISNKHYNTPLCCTTRQTVGWIYKSTTESTLTETDGLQEPYNRKASHNAGSFLQNSVPPVVTSQVEVLCLYSLKL